MTTSTGDLQTLYIVCDISGSLAENGKRMLLRGIARTIEQYIRFGYGAGVLKLVLWNSTASVAEWNPDDEFPEQLLKCYGPNNAENLCALLDSAPEGKIILLTDGYWTKDDTAVLKRWERKLPSDTLRIIKIGGETSPLWRKKNVFSPEEVFSMLDGWLPRPDSSQNNDKADEW